MSCSLVDNHDHALLTVTSLAAEDPDGLGVVDLDGEDRMLGVGLRGGLEAGFYHGGGGGGICLRKRDAGGIEGGLGYGVVLHIVKG